MDDETKLTQDEELKQLVVERLKALPAGLKMSIGSDGIFSAKELIERVESGDRIGAKIMQVQLAFLRSLKSGVLLQDD